MKLYSIRLLVDDFARCFRFYRDVLGLKPVWGDESGPYAAFRANDEDGVGLAIFKRDLMAEAIPIGRFPLGSEVRDSSLFVLEVDDVDTIYDILRDRGVNFLNSPKDYPGWTIRAVHMRDPDGNLIELFSALAREQWTEEARKKDAETAVNE